MKRMLVIDDSLSVRESIRIIFQDTFQVETADPWQDVLSRLSAETFDLVTIGISGRVGQEIDLVRDIAAFNPALPLIALVDHAQRDAIEGLSLPSITELVVKPFNVFELREKVKQLQRKTSLSPYVRSPLKMRHIFQQQKIYFTPSVRYTLSEVTIKTKNASLIPVLLQGERGTGREIAAKWLHFRGPHLERPFLKLNAATLMEETFMHSFLLKEQGLFRPKNVGTLYIEEIGNLRWEVQERLLEMLSEGSIVTPDGREVAITFRVVVSSSQDLRELVYAEQLKEELFYKLNVMGVYLPPLRERREEVPALAQQIVEASAQRFTFKAKEITPDTLETLKNYLWPGNVRELESVLLRSLIFSSHEKLTHEDLRFGVEELATAHEGEEEKKIPERRSVVEVVRPEAKQTIEREVRPERGETVFGELVKELAHEIKNPLVAIKTFSQLLAERFDDQEFREKFYQITGENVDRIDRLVEKILSSARFSHPALTPVNLDSILEKSLARTRDAFKKKRVVFKKELKENLPPILTDEEQLHYVFDNILSTIYYAVPEGSEISLSSTTINVTPEEKERLPLEQLPNGHAVELSFSYPGDTAGKTVESHYSIELFLAREIVDKNLGMMETASSPDKTTITLKLPIAAGDKK